jgi:hypothetical protein
VQNPQADARDRDCANASNPLHLVSTSSAPNPDTEPAAGEPAAGVPEVESVLSQQTDDLRLTQINKRMYLSLHSLDVELRREQRLAACQEPASDQTSLQAQASNPSRSGGRHTGGQRTGTGDAGLSGAGAVTPAGTNSNLLSTAGDAGVGAGAAATAPAIAAAASSGTAPTAPTQSSLNGATPEGANFSRPGTPHKAAGATAMDGTGNGATAPKTRPGNDNDIVAHRLRKAAEQETDPAVRAKLWKEYTSYVQGTSAK